MLPGSRATQREHVLLPTRASAVNYGGTSDMAPLMGALLGRGHPLAVVQPGASHHGVVHVRLHRVGGIQHGADAALGWGGGGPMRNNNPQSRNRTEHTGLRRVHMDECKSRAVAWKPALA